MRTIGVLGLWMLAACAGTSKPAESSDDWARRPIVAAPAARSTMPAFGAMPDASAADRKDGAEVVAEAQRAEVAIASPLAAKAAAPAQSAPQPDDPKQHAADRKVQVAGIEGTLNNFDVRVAMDGKAREFGACHAPRLRKVPGLAGDVEFKIRVLADGSVASVAVPSSNVGDRALERCFTMVILATTFPRPHGGDANVSYTMSLGVSRPGREPEEWEADRIRHILVKRADDVRETCDLSSPRSYRATVYVNRRGKVVAAGVAGKNDQNGALDCIAEALRKWQMPKSKKKAFAKVSFPMVGAT